MPIGQGIAAIVLALAASASPGTAYDPHETFAPLELPAPPSATRGSDGMPTAAYWQNRADYQNHATLDPAAKTLTGEEEIAYANNSPSTLDVLWLQLDQNIYRPDSRAAAARNGKPGGHGEGYRIDSVEISTGDGKYQKVETVVSDTRMQVRLPRPLEPGGRYLLRIRYGFAIPDKSGGRMGWMAAKDGEIYDMAQWYPRMAVFDDVRGWDALPYLGHEFYLEYGDFDYWVTVPSNMLVAGSGALQNPVEVLTPTERDRLAQAAGSDATVMIRAPSEISDPTTRPKGDGTLTWHFRMEHTRDVAFSASPAFAWDAARINLPEGKSALAMSFYPAESAGADAWGRSTEYVKDAIENFSRRWGAYPWPCAVNVAGPTSAMEYPGIYFDGIEEKGAKLFEYTAHEAGHSWFPMMVGFDERRDGWMDEGFNTFIDVYESDDFNKGEFGPKRDDEFSEGAANPMDAILPILADPDAPILLSRSDTVIEKYRHAVMYFKSALGLMLLREQIIGPDRFDPAFRRFIAAWAFKHPKASDFFRAMESETGEDLTWFWRGWYFNTWSLDLAVTKVAYVDDNPKTGALITVEARDRLILPADLAITFADGTTRTVRLPAETWIRAASTAVYVDTTTPIESVTLDPDHRIPDRDRSNNSFVTATP